MAYRGQWDEEDRNDYLARFGRAEPAHPERKLLRAVLANAIETILKDAKAAAPRSVRLRREREDALAWVISTDRADPFAFANICEMLGIEAGWLRARVVGACRSTGDVRRKLTP